MENENNKNYLDERENPVENKSINLDPGNEIKSGPEEELISSSNKDGILGGEKKEEFNEAKNDMSMESEKIDEAGENNNKVLSAMEKGKSKDMTIPIVLGVAFLMIIAIVAGFYFLSNKEKPGIEKENFQQKILNESMMTMSGVESYAFEGDFNLNFTEINVDKNKFSLAMKFDGQADESDKNNIKSSFNIKPEITVSREGGGEDVSFDFSMKSFGKIGKEEVYFKLNDFDLGAAGLMYGEMIIPYKNRWYSLDMEKLREESGGFSEVDDFDFNKMVEDIEDLFKKYKMIKFQKDLGDTKLGDADVYHYQVKIDSEAVFDFYVELLKTIVPEIDSTANLEDFDAEIEESREEILAVANEVLANIKTEVWIGKDDKMIYKMAMSGKFDEEFMEKLEREIHNGFYDEIEEKDINMYEGGPESYDGLEEKNTNTGELSFSMNMTMSNFNQPINISKPEKSEDLMKVLEEAMAGVMGGMMIPEPGTGLKNDSDQDELSDEMETLYGTDPNNPDTDGDGFSDGDEVARGYDPLLRGGTKLDYDSLFKN